MVGARFRMLLDNRPSTRCVVDIPKPSRLFSSMITWVLSVEVAVLVDGGRRITLFVEEISVRIFRLSRFVVVLPRRAGSFILMFDSFLTSFFRPHLSFALALFLLCNLRWSSLPFLCRILIRNSAPVSNHWLPTVNVSLLGSIQLSMTSKTTNATITPKNPVAELHFVVSDSRVSPLLFV